ncbi:response regulator [Schleiferia thermophila]|jgi:response regulator RpfG family c-di-GMP phosphodiesterase|uniref:Response regulator receiver domain-containing protein n=1 Tax=Schleiferia thermophila TaxID=884107 RepID=A0A369A903_9FLAO|nr:response regulator [Schleiferia thermophila]RCX03894.1 response regulator receiver domain-containing protein [Schleiferia thermophila]GCD80126.1 hypothetical protein JCM30197_13730 [Schleiferia thermophila]
MITEKDLKNIQVIYVDDEVSNLTAFKSGFRRFYSVETFLSAQEALDWLEHHEAHVVISDQRMPNMLGTEFLGILYDKYPDTVRMLLTGYADIKAVIDAINVGHVFRYITKPWHEHDIRTAIESAYEMYRLKRENAELLQKLKRINEQLEFMYRQSILS